jgi:hypothetical protein
LGAVAQVGPAALQPLQQAEPVCPGLAELVLQRFGAAAVILVYSPRSVPIATARRPDATVRTAPRLALK